MTVIFSVASFLGHPWQRGAVIRSVSALWGGGGALMAWFRMSSKCDDSGWRNMSPCLQKMHVDCTFGLLKICINCAFGLLKSF